MASQLERFRRNVILTGIVAGLFIVIANSAVWANRYLSDTDRFTATAVASLTSESSTDALATEIVDTALADYPTIKGLVDDTAINFISGLLGSGRMEQALTKVVGRVQIFLTSPQKPPVVINLEGAKDTVNKLIQLSGREGETKIDPDKIPNEITVFDPAKFPNFYQYTVVLTWLSPLLALGALGLLAWPYLKDRSRYKEIMVIQGVCVAVAGLLALLVGPLFRPMLLSNIQSANMRVVVGNLFDAFVATFNSQTMYVIGAGLLSVAVVTGITVAQHYKSKPKPVAATKTATKSATKSASKKK